jgi:hypothetical protein
MDCGMRRRNRTPHDRRIADACGCRAYNRHLLTAASRAPANPS